MSLSVWSYRGRGGATQILFAGNTLLIEVTPESRTFVTSYNPGQLCDILEIRVVRTSALVSCTWSSRTSCRRPSYYCVYAPRQSRSISMTSVTTRRVNGLVIAFDLFNNNTQLEVDIELQHLETTHAGCHPSAEASCGDPRDDLRGGRLPTRPSNVNYTAF
ncbi:hypothetical protein DAEQUDRAFT_494358 [Daedalea quercina L-15889]|uniref:Uncharacterized protein n=1 Tax=Daedalea quercina L-15889 TaxID=1314783 RepID=A0A165MN08_9APHY|nr:hypothetical protein DAEQUDRAFT_494358 [Daedalea quercina L-15889]